RYPHERRNVTETDRDACGGVRPKHEKPERQDDQTSQRQRCEGPAMSLTQSEERDRDHEDARGCEHAPERDHEKRAQPGERWIGEERDRVGTEQSRIGSRRQEQHRPAGGAVMQERREDTDQQPHGSVDDEKDSACSEGRGPAGARLVHAVFGRALPTFPVPAFAASTLAFSAAMRSLTASAGVAASTSTARAEAGFDRSKSSSSSR